jgi:hypothetical protein
MRREGVRRDASRGVRLEGGIGRARGGGMYYGNLGYGDIDTK